MNKTLPYSCTWDLVTIAGYHAEFGELGHVHLGLERVDIVERALLHSYFFEMRHQLVRRRLASSSSVEALMFPAFSPPIPPIILHVLLFDL